MIDNRRNFLKKSAGLIAGSGIVASFINSYSSKNASAKSENNTKKKRIRWGMVINMRKCIDGCVKCIDACHEKHNVPDFGNSKDEIKWIWKNEYKKVFPSKNQQFQDQ